MSTKKQSNRLSMSKRGISSYLLNRPLTISFEVTYSCNARCKHCHLGGSIKNEKRAKPEEFAKLCYLYKPIVAQVSGGEPLLRRDLEEIIKALVVQGKAPFVVVTTNAALLKKSRYLSLRNAGVNEFSVSLDYPDERHDEFRNIPGLFKKIETLIREIKDEPRKGITLSCVVQSKNFRDLPKITQLAIDWGVKINFSTYTWLRTNNKEYMISKKDLPEFKEITNKLLELRRVHRNVFASEYIFNRMANFYRDEGIPNCRAGNRFFIINPDATLSPCGLIKRDYETLKELRQDFIPKNNCTSCNTSIRANCEKPALYQIRDNLSVLFA